MTVSLQDIINRIADGADTLLAEAGSRAQVRAAIEELLAAEHPRLSPADRAKVVAGVVAILDKEGFFEGSGADNVWDEEVAGEEE